MAENTTPQNEEVDLGNLFKIIGKGLSNFFNAIGNFFKSLLHYFILLLVFIRNHAIKLGIAIIVGALIGLVLDYTSPKKYSATMIVNPNFQSTKQLYNNIEFYHELVKQKDTLLLAEILNIDISEAAELKGFSIKPIRNEKEIYETFNYFVSEVDTTMVTNIDIEDFKKSFTIYDYKFHEIKVKATNNLIFEKLSTPIVSSIESNAYFRNKKSINDQNLSLNERVLKKSLEEVDTLRKIYNEVLIKEAERAETGTNITLAENAKKTSELELFEESLKLNEELIDNNREKAETTEIVNVVSNFSKVGTENRSVFSKYTFLISLAFAILTFSFILLSKLNTFLSTYK